MSASSDPQSSTASSQAWTDILADLRERNIIEIHGHVEAALKHAFERTIGKYIDCELKQPKPLDFWTVEPFRRFAYASAVMMVFRARQLGGDQPTRDQVRQAIDEVMASTRDKYCKTLADCPPTERAREEQFMGGTCPDGAIDWSTAP